MLVVLTLNNLLVIIITMTSFMFFEPQSIDDRPPAWHAHNVHTS